MNHQLMLVLFAVCLKVFAAAPNVGVSQDETRYLVVSFVPNDDPFNRAAKLLVDRHNGDLIHHEIDDLSSLLPKLRRLNPEFVAFVVKPNQLEVNLVQRLLKLSTELDHDPFVDFAYGFVTGRDADAAVRLVKSSNQPASENVAISQFGVIAGKSRRSTTQSLRWPMRSGSIPVTSFTAHGTDDSRDVTFINDSMKKMTGSILLFASHGYPDGLVGGPKASDIRSSDFHGKVAFNIACYTGVTGVWYEDDWKTSKVRRREVKPENSFCLQMIDSGIAGYFAYVTPRPAGPLMFGDAMVTASSGLPLGEIQRQISNRVVLAHILSGANGCVLDERKDGAAIQSNRSPGDIVREMSVGGILIGDPAFRPFSKMENADPGKMAVTRKGDKLIVELEVSTNLHHFHTSEQINYWGGQEPALRLEAVVPIGERTVTDVKLIASSLGEIPFKQVAAIETHQGEKFLRVKATFPRSKIRTTFSSLFRTGICGTFEISTKESKNDVKQIFRQTRNETSR